MPGPSQRLQGRAEALHPDFRGPARLRPPEETNAGTQSGGARHTPGDRPIVPPHPQGLSDSRTDTCRSREGIREETKRAGRGQLLPASNGYPSHWGCNPWGDLASGWLIRETWRSPRAEPGSQGMDRAVTPKKDAKRGARRHHDPSVRDFGSIRVPWAALHHLGTPAHPHHHGPRRHRLRFAF